MHLPLGAMQTDQQSVSSLQDLLITYPKSDLFNAAKNGDCAFIKKYLAYDGGGIYAKNEKGLTPLMLSAAHGKAEAVQLLLTQPVKIEEKDNLEYTALMHAAEGENVAVLEMLLKAGAKTECRNKEGSTPLMAAAYQARVENVKLLLSYSAHVNCQDTERGTPLMVAAIAGHEEITDILLSAGATVDACDNSQATSLLYAIYQGSPITVARLLSAGANVNRADDRKITPLIAAVQNGNKQNIQALIKAGARLDLVDKNNHAAFFHAALKNYDHMTRLLTGLTPIKPERHYDIVWSMETMKFSRTMQKIIGRSSKQANAKLFEAIQTNNLESLRRAVKRAKDIYCFNASGDTPLHAALEKRSSYMRDLHKERKQVSEKECDEFLANNKKIIGELIAINPRLLYIDNLAGMIPLYSMSTRHVDLLSALLTSKKISKHAGHKHSMDKSAEDEPSPKKIKLAAKDE